MWPDFEPRHVEHVADDIEQILAAGENVGAIVAVLFRAERAEGLAFHQLREADDGVERRAKLVAHVGEEFGLGAVGHLGLGLLLVVALGEIGELLRLRFQRPSRLPELGDGGEEQLLGFEQLLLVLLEIGDVGADRHIAAVAGAPLVDLQPAAVGEARLVGARIARAERLAAGFDVGLAVDERRRAERGQFGVGRADLRRFRRQVVQPLVLGVAQHQAVRRVPQDERFRDRFDRLAQPLVGGRRQFGLALLVR